MTEKKKQLAHIFDATQCIHCGACMNACSSTNFPELMNELIPGTDRFASNIRRISVEKDRPMQILVQCQQCSNAPCVTTCPFGANTYDENGLVVNHPERCIGCNYCVASCPYDARWSHPKTGLPVKCMSEGCSELVRQGLDPACVTACPASARLFGDVMDENSAISQRIRETRTMKLLESHGTQPNFFVVVSK